MPTLVGLGYSRLISAFMNHENLLNGLVEHMIILETFANEQIAEEFTKIKAIRLIVKI